MNYSPSSALKRFLITHFNDLHHLLEKEAAARQQNELEPSPFDELPGAA